MRDRDRPSKPLGAALRERDLRLKYGWTQDNLMRLVEEIRRDERHEPNRSRDAAVHDAANLALTLLSAFGSRVPAKLRDGAINKAIAQKKREGYDVDPESVRNAMRSRMRAKKP